MFKFDKEQRVYEIEGVKIGGQPGQLPTVLLGSIFYHNQKILTDEKIGLFNRNKAENLLKKEEEISDKSGNPRIVDVCCSWPKAFHKLIDFVAKTIDGPFSIDGSTAEVRIAGAKYVGEVGLSKRVVFNSITPIIREEELSAIKEAKIKYSIIMTLNTRNPTISGRLQVMDELLVAAQKAGVENILVDTTVFDLPDPGPVSKCGFKIKEKYGLPTGAGTYNAVERWMDIPKLSTTQYRLARSVAAVFPIVLGSDFILYGPIENSSTAYFSCSLADAYVAYCMKQEFGIKILTREHPLFKIFR